MSLAQRRAKSRAYARLRSARACGRSRNYSHPVNYGLIATGNQLILIRCASTTPKDPSRPHRRYRWSTLT